MRLEIFPTFQIHLSLDEFHAIDLVHGYYQIRFRSKSTFPYPFHVYCEQTNGNSDNRPCVVNAAGISKTVKIGFGEQSSDLNDVFKCTLNIHKRVDRLESVNVELQIELWYLDPESLPRLEEYKFVSKRTMNILLKPDRSTHCHRPIFFEYYSFSAVSITVHASMIAAVVSRKKAGPDPPINDKLRTYHREVCFRMLSSCLSLQNFIKRHSSFLVSPLNVETLNVGREEASLKVELEESVQAWLKLQEHVAALNIRLTQLFTQLLQLFASNKELREVMLEEFDHQRLKRLSEAFLFTEGTVQSLLHPTINPNLKYFDMIKKNGYLSKIKTLPVHVETCDSDSTNITMIIEQRYLPTSNSPHEYETPVITIPTFVTPTEEEISFPTTESNKLPERRSSGSNFAFCLPTCATDGDDSYELLGNNAKNDFLVVNDRFTKRRMTDPGALLQLEIEQVNSAKPSKSSLSPSGISIKAKSTSNLSNDDEEIDDAVKCCPATPSTSSESINEAFSARSPPTKKIVIKERSNSFSDRLVEQLDKDFIAFVHQKELCKQKLFFNGFRGCFYSDLAHISDHIPYFSSISKDAVEKRCFIDAHLIVFVHGLEGTSEDLSAYRNFLRVALPESHLIFLMSEVNQTETWTDVTGMAENLLDEILRYIQRLPRPPTKISFLAHSLGGLIVRTLCGLDGMKPFIPSLHTLLTLNSPHCGLIYNQRAANWGIILLQWWKQSVSLEQLTMKDSINIRETFLYKLSMNGAFGMFKNVLLVGCYHDLYVPGHSALVELCKTAITDPSPQGTIYTELLTNINESIVASSKHTTLVKYAVAHNLPKSQQVTGRAGEWGEVFQRRNQFAIQEWCQIASKSSALSKRLIYLVSVHIAAVDDDSFIEKLLIISAVKYFR